MLLFNGSITKCQLKSDAKINSYIVYSTLMKYFSLITLFFTLTTFSQQLKPIPNSEAIGDGFMGYDNHGFAYYNVNNALTKVKGRNAATYKNIRLGNIHRVDMLNPLLVLVFYADFNSVVILDNQLTEVKQINFSNLEKPIIVSAVGNASRNKIWAFNELTREIGHFDELRNEYLPLTQPIIGTIIHYETDFNTFSWVNDQRERYSCDIFGKVTSFGIVPKFDEIQFLENGAALIRSGNQIRHVKSNGAIKVLHELDQKTYKKFYYSQQKLAIFTTSGITNYKIITP